MSVTVDLRLGDCLEVLPTLADNSVDAIVADPPYNKVLDDDWDNAWASRAEYLEWLACHLREYQRVLKPNGSLFVFAYPRLAAYVEVEVGRRFNVLNHIVWEKQNLGSAARNSKEDLRAFVPLSERIVFAEHYGADSAAKGESGYGAACDRLRGFVFEPLRLYLRGEWERAGLTPDDANAACNTASMAGRHFFSRSQWCLPTAEHYASLQRYANEKGRKPAPPYEDYHDAPRSRFEPGKDGGGPEYLRADYEDLRADYEDLRRPFSVTARQQWTDVWRFNTSANEGMLHPAQKPLALMRHIVVASTRPGALVLDPFMGSGTVGVTCIQTGRYCLGIEKDPGYFEIARRRIEEAQLQECLPGL